MMQCVKAYEKLTVEAGLKGDRDAALAALLTNPLIGDYARAKGVFDEMLEAHKEYLPRFFS
jgi:6-phospho-beta-glucosidase